jgi:hypothetical protein
MSHCFVIYRPICWCRRTESSRTDLREFFLAHFFLFSSFGSRVHFFLTWDCILFWNAFLSNFNVSWQKWLHFLKWWNFYDFVWLHRFRFMLQSIRKKSVKKLYLEKSRLILFHQTWFILVFLSIIPWKVMKYCDIWQQRRRRQWNLLYTL